MEVGTIHAQVAEDRRRAPGSAVHVDGLGIGVDVNIKLDVGCHIGMDAATWSPAHAHGLSIECATVNSSQDDTSDNYGNYVPTSRDAIMAANASVHP